MLGKEYTDTITFNELMDELVKNSEGLASVDFEASPVEDKDTNEAVSNSD